MCENLHQPLRIDLRRIKINRVAIRGARRQDGDTHDALRIGPDQVLRTPRLQIDFDDWHVLVLGAMWQGYICGCAYAGYEK